MFVVAVFVLDVVEPLDVVDFLVLDNNDDKINPVLSSTFTLLHPFSSDNTSTFVFNVNFAKLSDDVVASFLKLTVLPFI